MFFCKLGDLSSKPAVVVLASLNMGERSTTLCQSYSSLSLPFPFEQMIFKREEWQSISLSAVVLRIEWEGPLKLGFV